MGRIFSIFLLVLVLVVVGGGVYIATWDQPAPTKEYRKVIPNDRFE